MLCHLALTEKDLKGPKNAIINPYPAELISLNFHQLEVVSRYRDPQPKVAVN